jgi:DNA polymerase-1
MSVAIIDGDEVIFKVALALQKTQYFIRRGDVRLFNSFNKESAFEYVCDDETLDIDSEIIVKPIEGYKERLDSIISRILLSTKTTKYLLCLSGNNNFRYKLATLLPYKGNRTTAIRPVYLDDLRSLVLKEYTCKVSDNNEADELMAYESKKIHNSVICSSDKDLKTVSGRLYNITRGTLSFITPIEARYNFYYQLLIGDVVDNIPSPYMLGEVKAKYCLSELSEDCSDFEMYSHVKEFYIKYLMAIDKDGNYKTKWYSDQDVDEVLTEVGNLLWMEHDLTGNSRWEIPHG